MKSATLSFICVLLLAVSSCEIPQSLTVKGNPGLYVPIGSPFAGMKREERLEYLISSENMRKMMNENSGKAGVGNELKIYEVSDDLAKALKDKGKIEDADVQIYLVRYPLAKMPLDLQKYTNGAMDAVNEKKQFTIPDIPAVIPGSSVYLTEKEGPQTTDTGPGGSDKPFIKIPLDNMAKLVKWVERSTTGIFGLEFVVDDANSELLNNLELLIPGLGLTEWRKGKLEDGKIRFYEPSKTMFYPRSQGDGINFSDLTEGNLLIYAKISGSVRGQILEPSMVFDWEKAAIDTVAGTDTEGSFTGEYPIDNNLSEFLGSGVTFKTVKGYMYMSGVHVEQASSEMTIEVTKTEIKGTHPLQDVPPPQFPDGDKFEKIHGAMLLEKDKMSFEDEEPLELSAMLTANNPTLKVAVLIEGMEITRDLLEDKDKDVAIQFDLLLMIPMDLKVETKDSSKAPSGIATNEKNETVNLSNYVMLDLGDSLQKGMGDGDLLGRKEGEENYLKDIAYIDIGLTLDPKTDFYINIIDSSKLAVLVTTKDGKTKRIMELRPPKTSLRLEGDFLNKIPFSPEFSVLLEKDNKAAGGGKENFGSFQIKRQKNAKFDFSLSVKAKTKLEYTMDF